MTNTFLIVFLWCLMEHLAVLFAPIGSPMFIAHSTNETQPRSNIRTVPVFAPVIMEFLFFLTDQVYELLYLLFLFHHGITIIQTIPMNAPILKVNMYIIYSFLSFVSLTIPRITKSAQGCAIPFPIALYLAVLEQDL